MSTTSLYVSSVSTTSERQSFNVLERLVLRVAHPRYMVFYAIGSLWAILGLWRHDWTIVVGALVISRVFGFIAVKDVSPQAMADTLLGKIALLHLQPVNLAVQTVGVLIACFGVWQHRTETILGGLSLLALGHGLGWAKVHPAFERR